MAYNDRHVFSAKVDLNGTADVAWFGGFSTRVQIHRLFVTLLDATTGAGVVQVDKVDSAGSRGTADIGEITVATGQAAGHIMYETPATPKILNIGETAIFETTDAADALAMVGCEYSILEQSLADVTNDTAA